MKKYLLLLFVPTFFLSEAAAFCGMFVASADTKLFNKTSKVILARDGNRNVVIMSNDYKGAAKEFALLVPVPTVLERSDINVIDAVIFDKFDAYSAPRITQYYDPSPCPTPRYRYRRRRVRAKFGGGEVLFCPIAVGDGERDYGVQVEAQYEVGEYDIVILSAERSNGLREWLKANDYNIPEAANEVLDPYIKSNMKFFVAKVRLDAYAETAQNLRPIQISYASDKFMLPIRLGMANSSGTQDLVIFALAKEGRIECTNYRTLQMPTDMAVPTFIAGDYGKFYKDVFDLQYQKQGKNAVFLEYAWNCSQMAPMKCDPCNGEPPTVPDFLAMGLPWANDTEATTYFTRLHVRYDRKHFPQDLQFQITPNTSHYQVRYYMTQPATHLDCDDAAGYIHSVVQRREAELANMEALSNWDADKYRADYLAPYTDMLDVNGNRRGKENNSVIIDFNVGALPPVISVQQAEISGNASIYAQIMGFGALVLLLITLFKKYYAKHKSAS